MAGRVDHWLRLNAANRVPRRLVCVNAQARAERTRGQTRFVYRHAAATFDLLATDGRPEAETMTAGFDTPADLWAWVAERTAPSHRTVLFAYSLSYLLRLTDALDELPRQGFKATRVVLSDYSCWARFVKGKRTLMLCDLRTWSPTTPAVIAGDLNRPAPRPPKGTEDAAAWARYTARNADLVRAAATNIVEWLHDDDLGDFRPTGHAQASACFRHRFLPERTVLVHWAGEVRDAERRAAWTGRAEVWRPGVHAGPLVEYDYSAAYAWIAEHEPVPTRLLGSVAVRARETLPEACERRCWLYEVDVDADAPVLPCQLDNHIVWPVGTFTTTAWDCELRLAAAEGARITLRRGWLYEQAPVLAPWARWVLAALDGAPPGDDPYRRRIVKVWSRSLIGRFALRYPDLQPLRTEDDCEVKIATVWDAKLERGVREIQIGREVFEQDGLTEGASSTPQIMSAVMALARVRLWRTMVAAGLESVLYVDTDSVLVDADGARRLDARLKQHHFPGLRRKATYSRADLRAPRNIDVDDERRVAGLPRDAWRNADGRFEADVWEGIATSLRRRRPSGVFKLHRSFTVGHDDYRREQLPGGLSAPYRLAQGVRVG